MYHIFFRIDCLEMSFRWMMLEMLPCTFRVDCAMLCKQNFHIILKNSRIFVCVLLKRIQRKRRHLIQEQYIIIFLPTLDERQTQKSTHTQPMPFVMVECM